MDENGWEYRTAYVEDIKGNIYSVMLNIAKARDGRNILYDFNNIRRVGNGVVPSNAKSKRGSHINPNSSGSIVPQSEEDVKHSVSDREYLSTVKRGDVKEAQRMVDEAAARRAIESEQNADRLLKLAEAIRKIAARVKKYIKDFAEGRRKRFAADGLDVGPIARETFINDAEALMKLADLFSAAAEKARENIESYGEKKNEGEGEKYSIKEDVNGEKYVEVEPSIYDNTNGASVASVIAKIISERFHNILEANGRQFRINATTNAEWRRSNDANKLLKNDPNGYNDKIKSISNADEIIAAARDWIGEEKYHQSKKNKFIEFARGYVNYKVGTRGYSADVLIGIQSDGSAVLYDIVNIKGKKIVEAPVSKRISNSLSSQETSTKRTIPQSEEDVKRSVSDREYLSAVKRGDMKEAQRMVDEAGKVIPLSQRFDSGDEDIRYSVEEGYSLKHYSDKQIFNWQNSKNIVIYENDTQLNDFVDFALQNDYGQKMYFGVIDNKLAKFILSKTGMDLSGYNLTLRASEIRKILNKSHGHDQREKLRGQRAINKEDFTNIPRVITAPDEIRLSGKLFEGKPVIEFEKTINGKTTVVTYVSRKHHDLTVQTMFSGKKKGSLATTPSGGGSFSQTSGTLSGTASNRRVSQKGKKVNNSDDNSYSVQDEVYDYIAAEYNRENGTVDLDKLIRRNPSAAVQTLYRKALETAHRILLPDGTSFVLDKETDAEGANVGSTAESSSPRPTITSASEKIVAQEDEKVNNSDDTKYVDSSGNEYSDLRFSVEEGQYSYEALVSKPDMVIPEIPTKVYNRSETIRLAKENATKIGKKTNSGAVSVKVNDIDRYIILGGKGLKHGLTRDLTDISPITVHIGDILKNSILINELNPDRKDADYAYVLIGAARSANGYIYIVRSIVNGFTDSLESVDVLYAINTKKESVATTSPGVVKKLSVTDSIISISDLLDFVNKYFPDILPESVLRHYGYDRRPEGIIGESALYSVQDEDYDYIAAEYNRENGAVDLELDFSIVTSAYGHSKLNQYLKDNSILYIDPNKKRTNKWLSRTRLQLPVGENQRGSIRRITYSGGKIKIQNPIHETNLQRAMRAAGAIFFSENTCLVCRGVIGGIGSSALSLKTVRRTVFTRLRRARSSSSPLISFLLR